MKKIVGMLLISSLLLSNTGNLVVYANTELEASKESPSTVENVEEQLLEEPSLPEEKAEAALSEESGENNNTDQSSEISANKQLIKEDESAMDLPNLTSSADITVPEMILSTLIISKKEVNSGETVSLSLEINDQSKLKPVEVVYQKPQTENWMKVFFNL